MKVQDIRHVGLLSPAIATHARFYLEVWGLQSAGEDRHARYFRGALTEQPHSQPASSGTVRGLHHLAFSVDGREAVDAAATELERRGITLLAYPADLDEPGGGYGLRFIDPENRCIELLTGVVEHPNGWSVRKVGPAGYAMWVSTLGELMRPWRSTPKFSGFGSRIGLRTRWSSCDATGDITSLSSLVQITHRSTMLRT